MGSLDTMHATQGATKQTIDKIENHPISQFFKGSKKTGVFQKPITFHIRPPPPGCGQGARSIVQPAGAHDEVVHLQLAHLHRAKSRYARHCVAAHQLGQAPPREGEVAVVAEGDLGKEAVGGRERPQDVGCWVRGTGPLVFGLQTLADCVAEYSVHFSDILEKYPHTLAIALCPAIAQLVWARQAVRGGDPHIQPIVEVLKPG